MEDDSGDDELPALSFNSVEQSTNRNEAVATSSFPDSSSLTRPDDDDGEFDAWLFFFFSVVVVFPVARSTVKFVWSLNVIFCE